ncbi:MAG: hypothetical protein IPP90_05560 [Gemmatimonadaceae bacterium]|nr:hypothetical protein [Gemmatimonadaceae bacterium]
MNTHRFRSTCARIALMLAACALPATMLAQSNTTAISTDSNARTANSGSTEAPSPTIAISAPLAGPRIAPAALVSANRTSPLDDAPVPRDPGANVGPNLALMGVGAAGVVVGLLIGGDGGHAVAVGGAVIGLVGLYRYMR